MPPGLRNNQPAPRTYTFAAIADADGLKTSIATSTSVATYSGATLNGALANPGPATIPLTMNVSVTTTSQSNTYNITSPIVVTGTNAAGATITDSLTLTTDDGNETVAGTKAFATVTSIAVPAQSNTSGAFTFGVQNIVFDEAAREVRGGSAGNIVVGYDGSTTDTIPCLAGEHHKVFAKRIVSSGTTALPVTVYL